METFILIFFKFIYGFVSAISLMVGFYCHRYNKDKLIKFLKYTSFSLAWACGYWAIFKLFALETGDPKAYEFLISFTPLFVVSVYMLINFNKNNEIK